MDSRDCWEAVKTIGAEKHRIRNAQGFTEEERYRELGTLNLRIDELLLRAYPEIWYPGMPKLKKKKDAKHA